MNLGGLSGSRHEFGRVLGMNFWEGYQGSRHEFGRAIRVSGRNLGRYTGVERLLITKGYQGY